MVWGHCIQYCYPKGSDFYLDSTFKLIYSFHMPLFMFISGYLFEKSSYKYAGKTFDLIKHKMLSAIKPIIGGGVFIFIIKTIVTLILHNEVTIATLISSCVHSILGLWFLWSILVASLVMCLVSTFCKKNRISSILILIAGVFIVILFPNKVMNIYMYPYYVLGYFLGKKSIEGKLRFNYVYIALFVIMLFFYDKKHYIYTSGIIGSKYSLQEYLIIDAYRWLVGLVGLISVIEVIKFLYNKCSNNRTWDWAANIGKKSLQIYVLSVVFLSDFLPRILSISLNVDFINKLYNLVCANMFVYDFVFAFIIALFYISILFAITKLFEKIKISKFVFGR